MKRACKCRDEYSLFINRKPDIDLLVEALHLAKSRTHDSITFDKYSFNPVGAHHLF